MHLAELNVGRLIADKDDPSVAEFMDNIDRINNLGKRMPGFVWMMEGEDGPGNTDSMIDGDPRYVPNLTVWESLPHLENFVMKTLHAKFFERRKDWFEDLGKPHFVMWWIEVGREPTLSEALDRLDHLQRNGDSDFAFGWEFAKANPA